MNFVQIKSQQGIVLISSLFSMVLIVSFALLSLSVARFCMSYRHLQIAADAGVLAGVSELHNLNFSKVKNVAKNYVNLNEDLSKNQTIQVKIGFWDRNNKTFSELESTLANAVMVKVNIALPAYLSFFSINSFNATSIAVAYNFGKGCLVR